MSYLEVTSMSLPRAERRRHVVYITRNTEYHCRDQEVVAVRDRGSRSWQRWHPAIRSRLMGCMNPDRKVARRIRPGSKLILAGKQVLMTSSLLFAGRPPREALVHYQSLCWSGEIVA